jgi:hypothetical protein
LSTHWLRRSAQRKRGGINFQAFARFLLCSETAFQSISVILDIRLAKARRPNINKPAGRRAGFCKSSRHQFSKALQQLLKTQDSPECEPKR